MRFSSAGGGGGDFKLRIFLRIVNPVKKPPRGVIQYKLSLALVMFCTAQCTQLGAYTRQVHMAENS